MTTPLVTVLHGPKRAAPEEEWEDAACYDEATGVCAVADGAGSSYRAARWSSHLVESFVTRPPALSKDLAEFQRWVAAVGDEFQATSEAVSDTSWYAADASRRGSFATFAGIRITPGERPRLEGVYVGDACVFQCRGDKVVSATHNDPQLFDSTPDLLGSSPYQDSYGAERGRYITGEITPGDVVLIASDALSAAMLRLWRARKPIWETMARIGPAGFADLVERLRAADVMEDDDVTLMRVRTDGLAA